MKHKMATLLLTTLIILGGAGRVKAYTAEVNQTGRQTDITALSTR